MNRLMLMGACAVALSLGACEREVRADNDRSSETEIASGGGALRAISRLECPEKHGDLTRVSAAPDGRNCVYQARDAEVTLRLVNLQDGDADAVLTPLEDELKALMPPPKPKPAKPADPDGAGDKVEISLPGFSIKASDGDAKIRIGAMHIDADDQNAEVRIDGGDEQVNINATDGDAQVRTRKGGDDVRSTYILATETPGPSGLNVVGYEARGPKAGPLVVAVLKGREHQDDSDAFDDMRELVERNVGQ